MGEMIVFGNDSQWFELFDLLLQLSEVNLKARMFRPTQLCGHGELYDEVVTLFVKVARPDEGFHSDKTTMH